MEHAAEIAPYLQIRNGQPWTIKPTDRIIVVSQTCDIVAPSLAPEPYVEVLIAEVRAKIDSTKANSRSTRYLSFRVQPSGEILEVHAANRFFVPRTQFESHSPDSALSLDERTTAKISMWLGLRYTRPAWPQALVHRLNPLRPRIAEILIEVREDMAQIRVAISNRCEELDPASAYTLTVYGIITSEIYDNEPEKVEKCNSAFNRLIELLRSAPGIVVGEGSDVFPGHEFSWQLTEMTDLWNFANLSGE